MDLMNYKDMGFKDIERELNVGFDDFRNPDSIDPDEMRKKIFTKLQMLYPYIPFEYMKYDYTQNCIHIVDNWSHGGVENYCSPFIRINFRISVKNTKKVQRISRMRFHAVYAHNSKPIKITDVEFGCSFRESMWENPNDIDNLTMIINPKWTHQHDDLLRDKKFNTVSEMLSFVRTKYEQYFISDMTIPFFQTVHGMYSRKNMDGKVPKELIDAYKECGSNYQVASDQLKKYAFENFFKGAENVPCPNEGG